MKIRLSVILISILLLNTAVFAAEDFPVPAELAPDVAFWTRVYTEISTRSGFIHDSNDLSVVYETVTLTDNNRANRRKVRNVKAKYASILKTLATKSHKNLNAEQQRILDLWGVDVTKARLRKALGALRFQKGQSDRFAEGLKRAGEWRPYIEKVLTERGLPLELSALPHVESSFNPKAYSRVGASGLWQFTRSTGRRFMRVDYVVDERMDPFAATVAAAKLLEHNRQLTGSWPLSLTAYNHGAASIRRATKKLGTKDISKIVRKYQGRAFGFASRNFYVAFLAALAIDRAPEKYFDKINIVEPVQYELITLKKFYAAKDVAKALGLSMAKLKYYNPALLDPVWNGSKRMPAEYTLRVPVKMLAQPAEMLLATIARAKQYSEQTPDLFHKVVRGDTISEIAGRYGYRVSEVLALNGLSRKNYIRIGQRLRLPATEELLVAARAPVKRVTPKVTVKLQSTPKINIQEPAVVDDELASAANLSQQSNDTDLAIALAPTLAGDPADYAVDNNNNSIEVQASETLGHYADWLDIRASDLRRINGISYGRPVVLGRRIKLDFSKVSIAAFEQLRLAYQQDLQQKFFLAYQIQSVQEHTIRRGESLWILSQQKFKVPVWLLRQYNPDLDFDKLKPGLVIRVPVLD